MESEHHQRTNAHLNQLASVGQIAAGIAHEVKNPLTAVKGFLQLLKERNEPQYIDIAQSELENAIGILQNLLQVSRPDSEEEPFESIDLSAELESLILLFQDQFYRVELIRDFRNPGQYIRGKKNQLKKAIFNLLKNAFEAIPGKGAITVGHDATDSEVIVYIQDSGTGIPKHKLSMLGTPFFSTKEDGTGMGLPLVFSVIYQHNGTVDVESEEQRGTRFTITLPRETGMKKNKEVLRLELDVSNSANLVEFFADNRDTFEERLLSEAVNVRERIDELLAVGNINLLDNAYRLVLYVVEGKEHDVISFARTEGVAWAKHSLTVAFKLEWIQAVRRVMWDFLYNYDRITNHLSNKEEFYGLEKQINDLMDLFFSHFFLSFSQFKDDLIRSQRELMADLSVPIIPLTPSISILPLIGAVDESRSAIIEEKVLSQIGNNRIETLIIDLSGVIEMSPGVIRDLISLLEGIKMMGCESVITGIRPEIVKTMIRHGLTFGTKATTKGTLQHALIDHLAQWSAST
ncbi:ATP-binding protein [Cohnella lubricantis]|uniref:ATP-binding protein n=1 Tax=Cohnella lubricantis TaxID=2163172 RepID=UPI002892FB7C|nr:ATP-binding protein [Cohnella lubricantis]MBP2119698.1 rsbT co-antagonist protein RsbR [Cohnella lubricantis]